MEKVNLDWSNLSFSYMKTDKRYVAYYKNGKWGEGQLVDDNQIKLSEGSTGLNYGQQCFEGMKAQTTKDGRVLLFRPDMNAKRINRSADAIMMPTIPEEMFLEAIKMAVKANMKWVPPYGKGASLYIRPLLFGVGDNLGVKPSEEYMFTVYVCPVGPYFKGGLKPVKLLIPDYDRAAPRGTGSYKVGGNYAASMKAGSAAKSKGYGECLYLDAKTRTYIEETGASNFFGIKGDTFVTPKSDSILPSITKLSLIDIARDQFNMTVEERDVLVAELEEFTEAGAMGTAAVITPVGEIVGSDKTYKYGEEIGPWTKKLYDRLTDIQKGDHEAPEGWMVEV